MRSSVLLLLMVISMQSAQAQKLASCTCDEKLLDKEALALCKMDSAYAEYVIGAVNFRIVFGTKILPKYRVLRRSLVLPDTLRLGIEELKAIHDSTMDHWLPVILRDMYTNQHHVSPNGYVTSLLSMETFHLYPDYYAMVLNSIHLVLHPLADPVAVRKFQAAADRVYGSIPPDLLVKVSGWVSELIRERSALIDASFQLPFQGSILDEERRKYDVLNFLIWME